MDDSVETERKRCVGIVQMARAGDIDPDFRSIIHRIESGDTVEEIKDEIRAHAKAHARGDFSAD